MTTSKTKIPIHGNGYSNLDFVYSDKRVLGGVVCFKNTRVPVHTVLDHLSLGWSLTRLHTAFPTIKPQYLTKLLNHFSDEFKSRYDQERT